MDYEMHMESFQINAIQIEYTSRYLYGFDDLGCM